MFDRELRHIDNRQDTQQPARSKPQIAGLCARMHVPHHTPGLSDLPQQLPSLIHSNHSVHHQCSSSSRHPFSTLLPSTSSSLPRSFVEFVLLRSFVATRSDFSSTRPPCHIGQMVCTDERGEPTEVKPTEVVTCPRIERGELAVAVIESFLRMRSEKTEDVCR